LYVKPGRVEGLAPGTYYYHPKEHGLVLLSPEALIDRSLYIQANQAIFDASAFALFFIGQLDAIVPMYGEWSRDFCMIEVGLMVQLLEMSAPAAQIGLCQIGGFDFEPIRHLFALEKGHIYLHGLLGGPIDAHQASLEAFLQDSGELGSMIEFLNAGDEAALSAASIALSAPRLGDEARMTERFIADLQSHLRARLPEYMIPETFTLLDALPLTANGKVDRRALPPPDHKARRLSSQAGYVEPGTELERTLTSVWQQLLQVEQIGTHDNFFERGGNSLLIVRLQGKLHEVLGRELSIAELFKYPTINSLSEYLSQTPDKKPSVAQESRDRGGARREAMLQRQRRQ
jgi:SagB-type dehydrogenase family enzyme